MSYQDNLLTNNSSLLNSTANTSLLSTNPMLIPDIFRKDAEKKATQPGPTIENANNLNKFPGIDKYKTEINQSVDTDFDTAKSKTAPSLEYVTCSDGQIYINGILLDECYDIQYVYKEFKEPIYGYNSKHYDKMLPGTVIIYGSFTINYKHDGYLYAVLQAPYTKSIKDAEKKIASTKELNNLYKKNINSYKVLQDKLKEDISKLKEGAGILEVIQQEKRVLSDYYDLRKMDLDTKYNDIINKENTLLQSMTPEELEKTMAQLNKFRSNIDLVGKADQNIQEVAKVYNERISANQISTNSLIKEREILAQQEKEYYSVLSKSNISNELLEVITPKIKIGFDVDDCLAFTTPAFTVASEKFDNDPDRFKNPSFWDAVNQADKEHSTFKTSVVNIMREYQASGDEVYAITARNPGLSQESIDSFKSWLSDSLQIPKSNIIFAPKGKDTVIKNIGITKFYGDSDSDIFDARKGGAEGIRVERAPESSYTAKYNPGIYEETIIYDTKY